MGTTWRAYGVGRLAVWISAGIFVTAGGGLLLYTMRGQPVAECLAAAGERRVAWLWGDDVPLAETEPGPTNAVEAYTESAGTEIVTSYVGRVTVTFSGLNQGTLRVIGGATNTFTTANWWQPQYVSFGRSGEISGDAIKYYALKLDGAAAGSVYVLEFSPFVAIGEETTEGGVTRSPGLGVQIGESYTQNVFSVRLAAAPSNTMTVTTNVLTRKVYAYKGLSLGDRRLGGTLDKRLFPAVRRLCGAWLEELGWYEDGTWGGKTYELPGTSELKTRDDIFWLDPRQSVGAALRPVEIRDDLANTSQLVTEVAAATVWSYYDGEGAWLYDVERPRKAMVQEAEYGVTNVGESVWTTALRTPEMNAPPYPWTNAAAGNWVTNLPLAGRIARLGWCDMTQDEGDDPGVTNATGCTRGWWDWIGNGSNHYAFAKELRRRDVLATQDIAQVQAALTNLTRTLCLIDARRLGTNDCAEAMTVERALYRYAATNDTGTDCVAEPEFDALGKFQEWAGDDADASVTNGWTGMGGETPLYEFAYEYTAINEWNSQTTNGNYYFASWSQTRELDVQARGQQMRGLKLPYPSAWAVTNGYVARIEVWAAAAAEMYPDPSGISGGNLTQDADGWWEEATFAGGGSMKKPPAFGGGFGAAGTLPGTRADQTFDVTTTEDALEYVDTGAPDGTIRGASHQIAHRLVKLAEVDNPTEPLTFDLGNALWDWTECMESDAQADGWRVGGVIAEGPPSGWYPAESRSDTTYTANYRACLRVEYFVVVVTWKWQHLTGLYTPSAWTPEWAQ